MGLTPHDPEAEITRLKDWRAALAYKAEQAVDMESGAIVAVITPARRISAARGKRLQAGRGDRVERTFAYQFDTGGLDRLYVRGLVNVH